MDLQASELPETAPAPRVDASVAPARSDAVVRVLITGTSEPTWDAVAAALKNDLVPAGLAVAEETCVVTPGAEARLRDFLRQSEGRVIAMVDHPERMLARWLDGHAPKGAAAVLSRWVAGARLLLRLAQAWPGRLVMLETEDAEAAGDTLASVLRDWTLGAPSGATPRPAPSRPDDPLPRLAACALLTGEAAAALRLYDELLAGCLLLSTAPRRNAAALAEAVLAQSRTQADQLVAARQQVTALEALQKDTAAEVELLLDQVLQLQHEVRAQAFRSTGLQRDVEQAGRRIAQMQQDAEAEAVRASALQSDLEQAERQIAQMRQSQQDAEQTHRRAIERETERADTLVAQLNQARQDAEEQYLRAAASEREIARAGLPEQALVRAEALRVVHVRDQGEHRHVHAALARVMQRQREIAELELRLVEHHGRPGLVVFSTQGAYEALATWQRDGEEKGRGYMLLVPSDTSARERLLRLGTSDWMMVLGLARILRHDLADASETVPRHWQTIAARLVRQLEELPPRLRYDRLDAGPGPDGTVDVTLARTLWGHTPLGSVHLRWSLRDRSLRWLAPESPAAAPLPDWPSDEHGRLASEFVLPLGHGRPASECRRCWQDASPAVRSLYLALLDPLAGSDAVPVELRRAVDSFRREGRRRLLRVRARAAIQHLLRRKT